MNVLLSNNLKIHKATQFSNHNPVSFCLFSTFANKLSNLRPLNYDYPPTSIRTRTPSKAIQFYSVIFFLLPKLGPSKVTII